VGAHNQLGLSWGSPQSPQCGGLTVDQLMSVDFSKIDFSAFQSQVQSSTATLGSDALSIMQNTATVKVNK
jgi:conjugal transfer mating pair stabilization protein TraN